MLYQSMYSLINQALSIVIFLLIKVFKDLSVCCHRLFLLCRARIRARLCVVIGILTLRLKLIVLIAVISFISAVWKLSFMISRKVISFWNVIKGIVFICFWKLFDLLFTAFPSSTITNYTHAQFYYANLIKFVTSQSIFSHDHPYSAHDFISSFISLDISLKDLRFYQKIALITDVIASIFFSNLG